MSKFAKIEFLKFELRIQVGSLLEKKVECSGLTLKITSLTNQRIKAKLSSENFLNICVSNVQQKHEPG